MLDLKFNAYDIGYVREHCYKLNPEHHVLESSGNDGDSIEFISFTEHDLAIIKDGILYMIYHYDNEDTAEFIRNPFGPPLGSIEETVFAILAIVTTMLPRHLATKLPYETNPINYQ